MTEKPVQYPALDRGSKEAQPKVQASRSAYNVIMTSVGVFVCMAFAFTALVIIRFNFWRQETIWITWTMVGVLCISAVIASLTILIENRRVAIKGGKKLFELEKDNSQELG